MGWRKVRGSIALGIIGGFVVLSAQPALALTVAPDTTWRTNGKVYALARFGDTLYLGGKFSRVVSPDGTQEITARNVAAFDMATGTPISSFSAAVTNTTATGAPWVRALDVSPDGSTLFIGGKFDTVGGEPHSNLGAVSTADGSVVSTFTLSAKAAVNAILTGPDRFYFGGDFTRVNSKPRMRLAAAAFDGTLDTSWLPSADNTVRSLTWAADGATIFVGGKYLNMNGQPRTSVAQVTPDTGALDPWAIPAGVIDAGNPAWDLLVTPTRVFGGFGNGPNYVASFRLDNGDVGSQVWRFGTVGNVESLAFNATGSRMFVGGHFGTARLQQNVCGNIPLHGLMMMDPVNGQVDCSWVPQITPFGANYVGAWALLSTSTQLWVGGFFNHISGVDQYGIARYTL